MLRFEEQENKQIARIKVIGVGGGGTNAVDHMIETGITGVEFAVVNTDVQALAKSKSPEKIQIGKNITRGMGTGGNPELGNQAALDDQELIREMIEGVDILFLTAGFGGGTGTGASPVISRIAREMGTLTVGVITKPFTFEGRKRMNQAEHGIHAFKDAVDTIVCVPNDKLFDLISEDTPLYEAYRMTDNILYQAVESISQVIIQPGLINLDFADIHSILAIRGGAVIGFGEGSGKDKAAKAIQAALASPLLEVKNMRGAKGVLISIIGGRDLALYEVNSAIGTIHEIVDDDADIIIGAIIRDDIKDKAMVTLMATGLEIESQILPMKQKAVPKPFVQFSEPEPAEEPAYAQESEEEPEPEQNEEGPEEVVAYQEEFHTEQEPEEDAYSHTPDFMEESVAAQRDEQIEEQEPEPVFEEDEEEEEEPEEEPAGFTSFSNATQRLKDLPQSEFFDKSDPTVYSGTNLDIPSFMRKKKNFARTE
ncbi:MAG: cell division protein FtsZ [Candidatus Auribacter fodinae]|jgi:cell division protein FtsZ|uniref:Cell division protein FtsZ n=1 Tax=Candidatus Auribacter fodinae TaxID=2093366 RepID=A0A3A4RG93_9BACT|nr:MAG: cell division protein FtsZ [Candidatus Auribacter fodinae]